MQKVQLFKINVEVPEKKQLVVYFDCIAKLHEYLMHLCSMYEHRSLFPRPCVFIACSTKFT